METELRVQASPVPAHTMLGRLGSIASAPIDWTGCLSKTGSKVVPPSRDLQTPPLAEPTKSSTLPSGVGRAATAAMRPLMAAEPMLRAPSPEITDLLNTALVLATRSDGAVAAAPGAAFGAPATVVTATNAATIEARSIAGATKRPPSPRPRAAPPR